MLCSSSPQQLAVPRSGNLTRVGCRTALTPSTSACLTSCPPFPPPQVMEAAGKHQVLIFVHSRKETAKTARFLKDECLKNDSLTTILRDDSASREILQVLAHGCCTLQRCAAVCGAALCWCVQCVAAAQAPHPTLLHPCSDSVAALPLLPLCPTCPAD